MRAIDRLLDSDRTAVRISVYQENEFKILQPIVKQVLSAPASSASCERVFSQAELMIKPTRSRLSKELLSMLVFLKCNYKH